MKTMTFAFAAMLAAAVTLSAQVRPGGPGRGMGPGPGMGMGPGMMWGGPGSRTPITGAPYSGLETTQMQHTLENGNQINRQEQSKVYRDSQGRVRMEHSATGQTRTSITIFDPVGGFVYMLNPDTKTAVKRPLRTPPAGAADQQRPMRPGRAPAAAARAGPPRPTPLRSPAPSARCGPSG